MGTTWAGAGVADEESSDRTDEGNGHRRAAKKEIVTRSESWAWGTAGKIGSEAKS
jgi:hypothetical protein